MIELMVPIVRTGSGGCTEYKVGRGPRIPPLVEISVLFYDMQRSMLNQNHQTSKSQWNTLLDKYLLYSNFVLIVSKES